MRFNPAIEGRIGTTWVLVCSPFGIEPIVDPTTWSILASTRPEFVSVPLRGLPTNMSAGLIAMQSYMGTQRFSYVTLAEMLAYPGVVLSDELIEREISAGDFIREKAPLYAELVRQMSKLARNFGVTNDRVRLVYGFD